VGHQGLEGLDYWTNREATGVKELPERLLILGGGPVGIELGQVFSRFGTSVVLVEGERRLLPREGEGASGAIREALEADGIDLRLGRFAKEARKQDGAFVLSFEDGEELRGDRLLVATGRQPRIDGLGLENAAIESGKTGIEVDDRLRAGEAVWAVGDVTGISLFTHVGKYQARIARLRS
jgi:pyruvate/2-oxoglutarate dehydrogenase complex dihydrolipoamide dehydrogenase (E3) component